MVIGKLLNVYVYEVIIFINKGRNLGIIVNIIFFVVGENGFSGMFLLSKFIKVKFKRGIVVIVVLFLLSLFG